MRLGVGLVAAAVGGVGAARRTARLVAVLAPPPAAAARRVRPPGPLARLRLRLGDVAGHGADGDGIDQRGDDAPRSRPRCWSSGRAPAARRRRRCSPRPASTSSCSRRARSSARARSCRSRSSRWTASTAPAASRRRSASRRSPTPRAAAPAAAPRSTAGCTAARPRTCSTAGARAPRRRLRPTDLYAICDEVERELSVQTVPGRPAAGQRGAAARRARPLGWRHDEIPRWMDYPAGPATRHGRRRSMTETYLPRADRRRCPPAHRPPRRPPRARRRPGAAGRSPRADGRPGTVDCRPRHRVRRGHPDAGAAAALGTAPPIGRSLAVHPTVKLAARFADEVNVADDVPVHQVKEFAPDLSFGGSASGPGLVALALSDSWDRFARRSRTGATSPSTTRRSRARAAGGCVRRPGLRDPVVTYRLTRRDATCSVRASPGWPC